jgi:ribonuclease P protein component
VVHLRRADVTGRSPARVGLVVSRAVGPAVIRNRVKRRLRHLLRDRLSLLPPAAVVVVRATPAAGSAPSVELAADLDRCLARLARTEAAKAGRA